ncbi:MAG: phosphodiester glycosidase family protein [Vicinamibacterales bacterium]
MIHPSDHASRPRGWSRRRLLPAAALVLAALAIVLSPRGVARAQAPVSHPYAGLTYIEATMTMPRPIRAHVLQIDLTAPGIRLMLTPPAGPRETVRQTTADFVATVHAQAGINGHFFLPFPSTDTAAWLVGFAASEGRVFSAFESPEQSFALVADAPAINIDRANHASIVHRDPARPDGLHVREPVEVWTALAGSAQIVTDGVVTIPDYRDAEHPDAALTPGSARNYVRGHSWYDVVTARSAIGLSGDGRTLTLFTVDARGGSEGMTVGEVATWLVERYDVRDALNIDGGGSTSLALQDPVTGTVALVNTSSDNPAGRAVGSSLAVFARPAR